jgi:hypothetical protein
MSSSEFSPEDCNQSGRKYPGIQYFLDADSLVSNLAYMLDFLGGSLQGSCKIKQADNIVAHLA